ncbi:phosphoribosylamine--glycine ligase [[Phormidium] sp. ETS-05]|uniref:phosphoribosylamine--glycine ligase n=1 Tax=[Phormidium] sp. ETS-05 TaxID=222819 RepID=UPI0018EED2ED|nr:phosphoribosylamine--glycine ligase [[Phormidium] sp. ETS-05]
MKVLVVGNGGREHALAWKLLNSPQVEQVFCAPGNAGTAAMAGCQNLPLAVDDFAGIRDFALANGIELVVVGPELPLSLGIVDYLRANQIMVFGPNQAGAQLEASKSWAKALMVEAGIPTAASATFTREEAAQAKAYVQQQGAPVVVKADGLAAGKGVCVARTVAEAEEAIESSFSGQFGAAGNIVVIEEFLTGQEASILALTDGEVIAPLLPAQDHKAIGEGDTGPNTGGMGAYAPTPVITPELMTQVQTEILEPTLATLRRRGIDYTGVIYAGLMISPTGEIKVLEFNCRFGDPETQAILPLLETPLDELMVACCSKSLAQLLPIRFLPEAAACVVMAAGGYPGDYEKGKIITGLEAANATGAQVFHAGTQLQGENIVTSGGRVLGVTATGATFAEALRRAYAAVDCIHFDGAYYRRDIGYRVTT